MSFKGPKIQPTRSATLAVQSVDSVDDNASVSSTNLPGLSYRPQVPVDDIFNSPSLPRRKRRQTYTGPNNNNNASNGGGGGQSAGIAANPHAKYARTLGNVSDAQSQTTLLAPPKLKHRAKSFSAGDRLATDDGGGNNNARQAHAQLQRRPSAGGHANGGAQLSRANSRSSLSARKKRVTWRSPLVDDRLDSEASVKFARAYSGSGPSFFGRSTSQSRLAVGDDLSSSSVDDNNSTGSAGSSGGRHKKRSKRHSGATGGKRSWLSWLNVFRLFAPTARPSAAEGVDKAAAYGADSSSSSGSNSSSSAGGAAGGESKQATDDSVVDFSLSLVELETKLGAAALQPAPLASSDGSGKPRTARSSLLFLAWRQALSTGAAAPPSSSGGGSGKVRPV